MADHRDEGDDYIVTQDVTNVAPTKPSFYPVQVLSPSFNAVNPSLVEVVHRVCGGSYEEVPNRNGNCFISVYSLIPTNRHSCHPKSILP